jgi:hypothetical protein
MSKCPIQFKLSILFAVTVRDLNCSLRTIVGMAAQSGGRSAALMPVAQFNPFEKLDKPVMHVGKRSPYADQHYGGLRRSRRIKCAFYGNA